MVIVTLAGGLGNQMFRYAMGYAVARRHGAVPYLDCRYFDSVPADHTVRRYELDRFQISGRLAGRVQTLVGVASRTYPKAGWAGRVVRRLPIPRLARFVDPHAGFDAAASVAPAWSFLDGHWQSERYFAHVRDDLLREFAFRHPPSAANAATLDRIAGAGPAVCVHVRRSDYLLPHQILRPVPASYYHQALAVMAGRVPGGRYFAFSDDPAWARANLPWPAGTTFVSHNVGVDDGEDLRLMMQCDHFITANSSFSWWGAWLGRAVDKVVLAPRRWFAEPHPSEADLVPTGWIRL